MIRYIQKQVEKDLKTKMVFVEGPRQCGKTTLAESIIRENGGVILNYDIDDHREAILKKNLPLQNQIICFDEIHKYFKWKNFLKGLFDQYKKSHQFLITGSARLDFYRKGGDSLQGRYFLIRMHPLSFKELKLSTQKELEKLLSLSPFPEPYLNLDEKEVNRWSREYRTRLVRQELMTIENVKNINLVDELSLRLPELVSGGLSINSLREDLGVSHETVTRWIGILENLYSIYRIAPFGSAKIKAIKKEQKHYHFDWNLIKEEGPRFENMIANHLLKWCHWIEDTTGDTVELRYFRNKLHLEVDFVIIRNRKPVLFVETKISDKEISKGLKFLKSKYKEVRAVQVLRVDDHYYTNADGIEVIPARQFLLELI